MVCKCHNVDKQLIISVIELVYSQVLIATEQTTLLCTLLLNVYIYSMITRFSIKRY